MTTDVAVWLIVHAVNGMIDAALLGAPGRLEDPRLAGAIVAHVLGAVGAKDASPRARCKAASR